MSLIDAQSRIGINAELARATNLITKAEYDRMTDGTVSTFDVDVARRVLSSAGSGFFGAPQRILGEKLLQAVEDKKGTQGLLDTLVESARDFFTLLRG